MASVRTPLAILACLGLLTAQLSGLHMHVDEHGYVGALTGTHVHGTTTPAAQHALGGHGNHDDNDRPDDGDHAGDRDVSVVELGVVASKLLFYFVWIGIGLLLVLQPDPKARISSIVLLPQIQRHRWRPPLRAPPPSLLSR